MASKTIRLIVDGCEQQIIFEQSTTVKELLEFVKYIKDLSSRNENWTCFSSVQNRFMSRDEQINQQQNEILIIETNSQSAKIDNNQEESNYIFLNIMVRNGNNTEEFQANYDIQTSLDEIAQSILTHCQLSQNKNPPFVSLQIQHQTYNDVIKRSKSLAQLQIKNYTNIEAIITNLD
ncbi:unnamed protein product [Paramecium octaurelia]|uniref:Uncharacterized protein n=1 Tax=Paramecium octaurelia TaxID=43137 RepID=A0A8S1UVV4_PAROT|nr:unnamed protein product [Paramecium octaurelia]